MTAYGANEAVPWWRRDRAELPPQQTSTATRGLVGQSREQARELRHPGGCKLRHHIKPPGEMTKHTADLKA